jgi:hypothetical protein
MLRLNQVLTTLPTILVKTIHQLVQEHIARSAALVTNPLSFSQESGRMIGRIAERLRQDPSIELYAQHMAGALRGYGTTANTLLAGGSSSSQTVI